MTVQAYIIATEQQNIDAMALNDTVAGVDGGLIDNPMANSLGEGVLVGKYVFPARLLNDPLYVRWTLPSTNFSDGLGALPIRTMDSEVLFLPPSTEI